MEYRIKRLEEGSQVKAIVKLKNNTVQREVVAEPEDNIDQMEVLEGSRQASLEDGAELWSKLGYERLKLNIDSALFDEDERYSFGGVVRDHKGWVVAWDCRTVDWASYIPKNVKAPMTLKNCYHG
uniref:Uncharacterized protein n=1 Tax=Cannabis sativa TaxID=3483 RepID=A0A803Q9Y0_CANSA